METDQNQSETDLWVRAQREFLCAKAAVGDTVVIMQDDRVVEVPAQELVEKISKQDMGT